MEVTLNKSRDGGALVVTLVVAVIMGIAICSYLTLLGSRNKIAMRSTAWNTAMPTVEEGIEEALAHLHADPSTPSANGWGSTNVAGQTGYWKRRTNSEGSYFFATIYNYSATNPIIYSAGFVPTPLGGSGDYITRLVRVQATNSPTVFSKNIAAGGQITLSGGAVIDGYNSSNGPYNTTSNRNAVGGIVTNSKVSKAINVGTATVYGTASTGPGGTVYVNGGAVGDTTWDASNTGIEPGWTNNNVNVSYPTNSPPTGSPFTPSITSGGGSNIMYLGSGLYQTASFTSSDSTKPMVVTGNATLWITGDLTVSGSGYIYISPGASLTLYVGGQATVSGGGVVNGTGLPSNFSLVGLSSSDKMTYSGSADFVGTINAPEADVTVSGGADVYGAVICSTFTSSGGSGVHYDQGLAGFTGLVVIAWTEL